MILRYLIVIGISVVVGIIVGITEAISLDAGERITVLSSHSNVADRS